MTTHFPTDDLSHFDLFGCPASIPASAYCAEPLTTIEIDAHPDAARIWATIEAQRHIARREIEVQSEELARAEMEDASLQGANDLAEQLDGISITAEIDGTGALIFDADKLARFDNPDIEEAERMVDDYLSAALDRLSDAIRAEYLVTYRGNSV